MIRTKKIPQYVRDFLEVIYPGNVELAIIFFDEQHTLEVATELIQKLRIRLSKYEDLGELG